MERKSAGLEACHIEYNYLNKHGDCIDLNTLDDTYYIFPHAEKYSITKIALATEEIYHMAMEKARVKRDSAKSFAKENEKELERA